MRLLLLLSVATCWGQVPALVGSPVVVTTVGVTNVNPRAQANAAFTAVGGADHLLLACPAVKASTLQAWEVSDQINGAWSPQPGDIFTTDTTNGPSAGCYHFLHPTSGNLTIKLVADGPGGGTLTINGGFTVIVSEWSGFPNSTVIGDGSNPFTKLGNSATASAASIQTVNPNVLLIAPITTDATSAGCLPSVPSGWILLASNSDGTSFPCAGVMYQIAPAGNYSISQPVTSAHWVIGMVPYVPVASTPVVATTTTTTLASNAAYGSNLNTTNAAATAFTTYNGKQYIGYFANDLTPRIAVRTLSTNAVTVCNPGLPANSSSDNHESISLQLDQGGHIHLTYGMHVTALNYYESTNPLDCSAFTGPLMMLGSTQEVDVTFGEFFRHPTTNELYFWFQEGGGSAAAQWLYHFREGFGWEGAAGTSGTGVNKGKITDFGGGPGVAMMTPPRLDPRDITGNTWIFQWIDWVNGVCCGPDEYLMSWDGSTFKKFSGAAQAIPVTLANLAPIFSIGSGPQSCLGVLGSFSIDSAGTFFIPYKNCDGNGIEQQYVAESSTGSFVSHQLTQNSIAFNPPNPLQFAGTKQSNSVVSSGPCTYVTYNDIYTQRAGRAALKSCDNFTTAQKMFLTLNNDPSGQWYQDQALQSINGTISFISQQANDPQLMFSPFTAYTPNIGTISMMDIVPPSSYESGNSATKGNGVFK